MIDCMVNPADLFLGIEPVAAPSAAGGGGGASFGVKWSDDFNRADNAALGGDWTEHATHNFWSISNNAMVRSSFNSSDRGNARAGGDAVATGKTRLRLDASGCLANQADGRLVVAIMSADQDFLTAGNNGYALSQYTSGDMYVTRRVGTGTTILASRTVGVNTSTPVKVSLEVEQSDTSAVIRVYADDVQIGADIEDSSPGDAADIFTTARPVLYSTGSLSNNVVIDGVEFSY